MSLTAITSEEQFKAKISNKVVCIHFTAKWCAPCADMNKICEQLALKHPQIAFYTIDAEELADLTEKFDISAVPAFLLLKNGVTLSKLEGANPTELTTLVSNAAEAAQQQKQEVLTKEELNQRLSKLVNSAPIIVFMKGSASAPRCGFSLKLLNIFKKYNIQFQSFDILSDDQVREGMKAFSNWPTFPQIYAKGKLIGGLDIVKELDESGQLLNELGLPPVHVPPLHEKLEKLINYAPIMIFMKGTPEAPICGFSKKLCEILNKNSVQFSAFDILSDEEVRQGLKTYSNWPTFPQVYSKGKLIGGLDIVKELDESKELLEALDMQ